MAIEIGLLKVDMAARAVSYAGEAVPLRKMEFDLLFFLITNKNRVVSRQAIAEHLYDGESDQAPGPEFVYSHIKNLKRALKEKGCPEIIQSVYGLGYKLEA